MLDQSELGVLETSLIDFIQVAFWAGQNAENKFKMPLDHLKYRFLAFTQVVFWAVQEADNEFKLPI